MCYTGIRLTTTDVENAVSSLKPLSPSFQGQITSYFRTPHTCLAGLVVLQLGHTSEPPEGPLKRHTQGLAPDRWNQDRSILLRLFAFIVFVCWKCCIVECYCASLPNSTFSKVTLVLSNQPNWQMLQIKARYCFVALSVMENT